jgi:hypothetical protein
MHATRGSHHDNEGINTSGGVFLYELVPSDNPVMWCLYEGKKLRPFFYYFPNGHFFSPEQ